MTVRIEWKEAAREITGTPYIAIYRVTAGTITLLRVLHGAQQWPKRV